MGAIHLDKAAWWLQGGRVDLEELEGGVVMISMSTRLTRSFPMIVTAYLVGDVLIDTGFAHVSHLLGERLSSTRISAICCTHNHEDHTGGCASLSRRWGCSVYLRHAEARWGEGVSRMRPYRHIFWGAPEPYHPLEMPEEVTSERCRLRVIPTPGHSRTHVAFLDEATGTVFTGDLFVSAGVSAVMTHENPYQLIESLRRVAAEEPSLMLSGHGLRITHPSEVIRRKADRIESAAEKVVELHRRGVGVQEILRRIFPQGAAKDRFSQWMTEGEFSRPNFVRACLVHRPDHLRTTAPSTDDLRL